MVRLLRGICIGCVVLPIILLSGGCGQDEKNSASPTVTATSTAAAGAVPSNHPCEYLSEPALSAVMRVKMTGTVAHPELTGTGDPSCAYMNAGTGDVVTVREITSPSEYAENVCKAFPEAAVQYRDGIEGCAFDEKAFLVPFDKKFVLEISYPHLKPQYQPGKNFGHLVGKEMVENL